VPKTRRYELADSTILHHFVPNLSA